MTTGINDTNIVKKLVGQRLTKVRKSRGLTRQGAVDALNENSRAPSFENRKFLGIETYKKWEYGENPVDIEWFPSICEVYSCDVGYLFGNYEEFTKELAKIKADTGLDQETASVLRSIKSRSDMEDVSGAFGLAASSTHALRALNCLIQNENNFYLLSSIYSVLFGNYDILSIDYRNKEGHIEQLSAGMAALRSTNGKDADTTIRAKDAQAIFLLNIQTTLLDLRDKVQGTDRHNPPIKVDFD